MDLQETNMTVDLLDVLSVDWVRIPGNGFSGHYRRVVVAGSLPEDQLRQVWRDRRGTTWAVAKTERDKNATTIYFIPV